MRTANRHKDRDRARAAAAQLDAGDPPAEPIEDTPARLVDRLLETDTVVRAVRTLVQVLVAAAIVAVVAFLAEGLERYAPAGVALLTPLVAFVQNELEDAGRIRDRR